MIDHPPTARKRRRRGFALIMTGVMLITLVGFTGLAIDVSTMYAIKAKLQKSVDAAAIAGASSLSAGQDTAAQTVSATAAASKYFYANFPVNGWGVTSLNINTVVTVLANARTVAVTGTLSAPTYFMRAFNFTTIPMTALGSATRRDANIIIVLDRSGSMCLGNSQPCTAYACAVMKAAAQSFVQKFAPNRDRLGLVTFGGSVWSEGPTQDFLSASGSPQSSGPGGVDLAWNFANDIGTMQCQGATNSAGALSTASAMLQAINQPGALNAIVFFTDGQPTAVSGYFPRRGGGTPSTCGGAGTIPLNTSAEKAEMTVLGSPAPGNTAGLYNARATSITDTAEPVLSQGTYSNCYFRTTGVTSVSFDISALAAADLFGNRTSGADLFKGVLALTLSRLSGSDTTNFNMVVNASYNAADDAALRARTHATIPATIFSIGLGGSPGLPADSTWLARVANDPNGPTLYGSTYNSSQPSGYYVYSPDQNGIASAFNLVAAQILRLSR